MPHDTSHLNEPNEPHPLHPRPPAERFFWAVLTVERGFTSARHDLTSPIARAMLDEAFAAHLPVPSDEVARAYTPLPTLPDGGVLACAAPRVLLDTHPDAVTLAPGSPPPWLDRDVDLATLNVLIAEHEPVPVRAAARRRSLAAAGLVLAASLALAAGFERRAAHARAHADAARAELNRLASDRGLTIDEAADRIEREWSRLRATRATAASAGLADTAEPLADLLAAWPRGVRTQVQSLSVTPGQIALAATLPSHDDAERLAASLADAARWETAQPQITTRPQGVSMQLSLRPVARPAPTPTPASPNREVGP
jgi:hypothetical protein